MPLRQGRPVLDALESLRALEGRPGRVSASSVSLGVVTGRWRRLVLDNPQLGQDELDRRAYSFCVLEALQAALNSRDVFVTRSGRFTYPRAKLLSGSAWQATRPEICAGLGLASEPERALGQLAVQLNSAYRQTAERLDENLALQIAEVAGTDRPDLSKLEALEEPERLSTLRAIVAGLLPGRVAFSEVLLEVCRWSGFADAFTHLSEGRARAEDLHISVCAVLLAEACNISLTEVAQPANQAGFGDGDPRSASRADAAARPSTARGACHANSKRSAIPSRSSNRKRPNRPTGIHTTHARPCRDSTTAQTPLRERGHQHGD